MKSIKDTLETIQDIISALPVEVDIALAGGYAVISFNVSEFVQHLGVKGIF